MLTLAELIVVQHQYLNDLFALVDGFLRRRDVRREFADTSLGVVALIAERHQDRRVVRVRYPRPELRL
ncbi:hypothetical protein A5905_18070 [Prescottella equi]|nr:hypothetical protein A5905_18070 [Prescottella equi]